MTPEAEGQQKRRHSPAAVPRTKEVGLQMLCIDCKADTKVKDSRRFPEYVKRKRECTRCGSRSSTTERRGSMTVDDAINVILASDKGRQARDLLNEMYSQIDQAAVR